MLAQQIARVPGRRAMTKEQAIVDGEIRLSRQVLQSGQGISCLAWPEHVFFEHDAYDPALPQTNISETLTTTLTRSAT